MYVKWQTLYKINTSYALVREIEYLKEKSILIFALTIEIIKIVCYN